MIHLWLLLLPLGTPADDRLEPVPKPASPPAVQPEPDFPVEPAREPAPEPAPEGASAEELLEIARDRLAGRDPEGARIVLDQALDRPSPPVDTVLYLRGLSWELDHRPETAIALYDEGLERWPDSPLTPDRRFRKALALDALGTPRPALRTLRDLRKRDLAPADRRKYDLVEATLLVRKGRTRRGLRRLRRSLAALEPDELSWFRARARAALVEELDRQAGKKPLDVRQRRQVRRIADRAELVDRMETQATAIAELDEPAWVLEAVLHLGSAYEQLGDDLVDHRRPRRLTPDQLAIYEQEIGKRIEVVWVKALRTYELGIDMATRIGWASPRVDALEAARDRVTDKIEAGPPAG